MTSAIIKTENIVSFSYNPQKKWIEKEDLANQISIKVINDCGWSFGLIGKEGIDYFKSYFLEISKILSTKVCDSLSPLTTSPEKFILGSSSFKISICSKSGKILTM